MHDAHYTVDNLDYRLHRRAVCFHIRLVPSFNNLGHQHRIDRGLFPFRNVRRQRRADRDDVNRRIRRVYNAFRGSGLTYAYVINNFPGIRFRRACT